MTPLAELPVLLVDAQATAAFPRGSLLEVGWATSCAAGVGEQAADWVRSLLVAPPDEAVLPPAVARITGISRAEWARGTAERAAWQRLRTAAAALSPFPVATVIHFARFEEPFLRDLHGRHGDGAFPFRLVCTHAIARRLLPELPRRTLRALAGYFGAGVAPLRRSAEHVSATACVWRHLVALLGEREGIATLDDLDGWLATPARRSARAWPLARGRRLESPAGPGVYRLLRDGGGVVYVGKAASLRQRVSGHFQARGERALEMLTQVRDVAFTETPTALEAALLETDEIKRLAPPYNLALAANGRGVFFATPGLGDLRPCPDSEHAVGPLGSSAPFEALAALRALLENPRAASLPRRARALGVEPSWAPGPEEFDAGLAGFASAHATDTGARALLRLGARLWAARRDEEAVEDPADPEATRRPAWDGERVRLGLEETVRRAAHAVRRARWFTCLAECSLAWGPADGERRLLVVERGVVAGRGVLEPGAPLPVPPGHARAPGERRAAFDVAAFDRLRVLTTELRTLAGGRGAVDLRLGRHARLSRRRLRVVLRWV